MAAHASRATMAGGQEEHEEDGVGAGVSATPVTTTAAEQGALQSLLLFF